MSRLIGDKGDWNRIPRDEGLIRRLNEEAKKEAPNPGKENVEPPVKTSDVIITPSEGYWRIYDVKYKDGIYTVDLAKSLLDNGTAKTQDGWAEYTEQARKSGDFHSGDMPLQHATFTALFKQKDKPESEEAREFIKKNMREKWLMTLTRIKYTSKGLDEVIHNYRLNDSYSIQENIAGQNKAITNADSQALKTLLGTGDVSEIKAVYDWINSTDTYLWRLNQKPAKLIECVAWFDAFSGWADLGCGRHPGCSDASLGVRIVREAPRKT